MQEFIAASSLQGFSAACEKLGLNPARLCAEAGLDSLDEQTSEPVSISSATALLDLAQQSSGCDHFALLMVEHQESNIVNALGKLGLLISSAPDLGSAWRNGQSYYQALRNRDVHWCLSDAGSRLLMQFAYHGRRRSPLAIELTLARVFRWNRAVTRDQWLPQRVYLRRPAPQAERFYQQFFHCPLEFNAEYDGFLLKKTDLRIPLISANSRLHETLALQLNDPQKFSSRRLSQQVSFHITQGFANDEHQLCAVAAKLRMTPRSLQRRLVAEGSGFQALLTDARLQLSQYYLRHSQLGLREISLRVGFQNPGTFSRFFKAQEGLTPHAWRQLPRPNTLYP